jgi:stage II sporulation protein D
MTRFGGLHHAAGWRIRVCIAATVLPTCGILGDNTSEGGPDHGREGGRRVRNVRVRIADEASRVRLAATTPIIARDDLGAVRARFAANEKIVLICGADRTIRVRDRFRVASNIHLAAEGNGTFRISAQCDGRWSPEREYPGSVRLRATDEGRLEVINHVDLDRYVASVVASEVWPTFGVQACRAQAIAARTFVLYQMSRRPDRDVDVSATQGSQVYKGIRTDAVGRRASEAAEYTRGVVLAFESEGRYRLFCAYYSAACGGVSQSAAFFGAEGDVPPLRGGVKCDYCKIAPGDTYRWGPVELSVTEVTSRIVSRYPKLASLGTIRSIEPIERASSGRPVTLRITGSGGETHEILAERFRLAMGGMLVRSTDCRIRVQGGRVIFDNGKGFGHGVGLCQWGMHGQALQGKRAGAILRYYYPGARLVRVY